MSLRPACKIISSAAPLIRPSHGNWMTRHSKNDTDDARRSRADRDRSIKSRFSLKSTLYLRRKEDEEGNKRWWRSRSKKAGKQ